MSALLKRCAVLLLLLAGCGVPRSDDGPRAGPDGNANVRFGMPAPARADPESRDAFLIDRPQYVLSYNAGTRTPNWVCWRLRAEDIGNAPRAAFEPDPDLPRGVIARVTSDDYDGSGFDRGHQCPAKDRSATPEDCAATFYMTNVVPQSPASNQKAWERLEDYCRRLAKDGHTLYIASGPHGEGGTGKAGLRKVIGRNRKITVPAKLWKVILVLPGEDAEPRKNSRVIAVIMPNDQTVGYEWAGFRVSVREVERLTGFHFWPNLDPAVASALRSRVDRDEVPASGPHRGGGHRRGPGD